MARFFAEGWSDRASVAIDTSVYDKVRAFRAPNSRHPKTGLHKRRVTYDELMYVKAIAIAERATQPEPFEIPSFPQSNERAIEDWGRASMQVVQRCEATGRNDSASLNQATLQFIREGAVAGDRHRLLFSAAANLAEFNCPRDLAHALLTESARDSGLPPKDIKRQIDCGLNYEE